MTTAPGRTRTFTWDDPLAGARAARTLSGLDYLRAMARGELPGPPIAAALDIAIAAIEEGRVVFTMTPVEYHYNPIGTVHGGAIATICDRRWAAPFIRTSLPGPATPRWN